MIKLRKNTAAEKARKEKEQEAKKRLRKQKRVTKKDARQDKREIRQEAREEKKEIRRSDGTAKQKREAKKDVRKDKKGSLKDVRVAKRKDVKEIKGEIKEVRRTLEIKLPAKAGNVALLRADLRDLARPIEIEEAFEILDTAYERAKVLSGRGLRPLTQIVDGPRDRWVDDWAASSLLVQWFGNASRANYVKDVHDRLQSVDRRLNKQLVVRFHPQRTADRSAQNNGTFFEPRTFKVFPRLIENSLDSTSNQVDHDYIASVFIHELIHLWFTDQKINGVKVYEESQALQLARDEPAKARRSAENYERYCLTFA